ncbi:hypothetical protein NKJ46_34010 [Mesorhizobium sp. M0166]|uniref:ImmA/IrrE family metallo-endopeptidase n=1 Tax=unclassified Mesorhizobium TaxID=325217 RepID=UPI00333BB047
MNSRILLFALLSLAGCTADKASENSAERLGLQETTYGRQLIEDSAAKANNILGFRDTHRFVGSWQLTSPSESKTEFVPVYLISPESVSAVYSIMVPNNCGCVFIQPKALEAWIARYSTSVPHMLSVTPSDIVAFMLLHELGHVEHSDPGEFEAAKDPNSLNLDETEQKTREEQADNFALDLLTAASTDMDSLDGWLEAQSMQLALANLSWNLSAIRLLDNFGASVLCSRAVFQDAGYSHPNFELRMLYANDRLTKSPESHQLFASFEACRAKPQPLNLLEVPSEP